MCAFCDTHDSIEHFTLKKKLGNFWGKTKQCAIVMRGTKITVYQRKTQFITLDTGNKDLRDKTVNDMNAIFLVTKMCIIRHTGRHAAFLKYSR